MTIAAAQLWGQTIDYCADQGRGRAVQHRLHRTDQLRRNDRRLPVRLRFGRDQRHRRRASDGVRFGQRWDGFQRGVDATRLCGRRFLCWPARGPLRPSIHHAYRGRVLHRQRVGLGRRWGVRRIRALPCSRRPRRRRIERARARLHCGGHARGLSRKARYRAAGRHHRRLVHCVRLQLSDRQGRRVVAESNSGSVSRRGAGCSGSRSCPQRYSCWRY